MRGFVCVGAGIPPAQLSRFMGHAKVTSTLAIYTQLFDDDDAETMAALKDMSRPSATECCVDPAAWLERIFNPIQAESQCVARVSDQLVVAHYPDS
jgi:hypothetical protein